MKCDEERQSGSGFLWSQPEPDQRTTGQDQEGKGLALCLSRALAEAGIKRVINGPFTFAPDGNPLLKVIWGAIIGCVSWVMVAYVGIDGVKAALLRELASAEVFNDPLQLAGAIKALPIELIRPRPLDEAISTAGGVPFEQLTAELMLKALPGTFCAGEMLDWEAPTGGYLLTACFASGRRAAQGILDRLKH